MFHHAKTFCIFDQTNRGCMNEKVRSRLIGIVLFWAAAIIPFWGIFMINKVFGAYWFVTFMFIYVLIYRPILHIVRLLRLK
jgi:hypothetical protein